MKLLKISGTPHIEGGKLNGNSKGKNDLERTRKRWYP